MRDVLADAAVAALPAGIGPVEVLGETGLADAVRVRLAETQGPRGGRPAAVIDTTGEPRHIEAALRRVADLGTVVLAGPLPSGPVQLDLYADLHVRGLTVIGVPSPGEGAE
jgi:threonine dehydrogenase-like Zn-dependent dehydrogenase